MNESELEDEEESIICDELEQAVQAMKDTWRFASPPNEESNVSMLYGTKDRASLHVFFYKNK